MKIAIPTNDMLTISAHFGRSKGFMVFDVSGENITNFQYILNTFTHHAKTKGKEAEHVKHNHNHDGIFSALINCNVVISRGMGQRLFDEFKDRNVHVFITKENSINKSIEQFLKGTLEQNSEICCNH